MIKEYKKIYKEILKKIKEYQTIVVYRHQSPDFDASGTQNGLATWLKDSFPNKEIITLGKDFYDFTPSLYPHIDEVDVSNKKFLAIIVDTGNSARIDNDSFKKADFKIKFDHHPAVEDYADIAIVNEHLASCSELVLDFVSAFEKKYPLSPLAAKYFYAGIVGDSGRFLYSDVNSHTFEMALICINKGIDINNDVYLPMYEKNISNLTVTKYILNHYTLSSKGVAYYALTQKDLDELNIRCDQAKNFMSIFSNIKGINIWVSISENTEKNEFRVSIRSKKIAIDGVATQFGGGGHAQASGAKLKTLDELPNLIAALDNLVK